MPPRGRSPRLLPIPAAGNSVSSASETDSVRPLADSPARLQRPENFGLVDGVVPPVQRQNLSQVCKLLNQIAVGRLFGSDQPHLAPMNDFIRTSSESYLAWIQQGELFL